MKDINISLYLKTMSCILLDGRPGLGGLDIYVTQFVENGAFFTGIQNVGAPINSSTDDFGFFNQ
jgi:hypothetical protein